MFDGKMKAITFSYDDGATQDIKFVEFLNKYNLKATFNINSELLGDKGELILSGRRVDHNKIKKEDVKQVYSGHEIAVHTLTHPTLTKLDEAEIIRQVEQDRLNLSEIAGYEVVGMAYPNGGINNNEYVAEVIRNNTGVKYSRTITTSDNYDLQTNLMRFNPTVYHLDFDKMFEFANEFISLKPDTPKIFYVWGHTFEFDIHNTWDKFEEFCKIISNKTDIFYGTNKEILL